MVGTQFEFETGYDILNCSLYATIKETVVVDTSVFICRFIGFIFDIKFDIQCSLQTGLQHNLHASFFFCLWFNSRKILHLPITIIRTITDLCFSGVAYRGTERMPSSPHLLRLEHFGPPSSNRDLDASEKLRPLGFLTLATMPLLS